jgi:uncharacterized repeat protein (TIGR02543 family)
VAKAGYSWNNWTGDKASSDQRYTFTMPAEDVEITANATANTYTVVYDGNGATSGNTETSTHTYDEAKNLSANGYVREYTITYDYNYDGRDNTTKTVAYGFNGWNDDANGNGSVYSDEQSVINLVHTNNGSKTLYANWKLSSDTNIPTRDGYKFTGWYTSENTTGNRVDRTGKYTPTADITLYAGWVLDDGSTKTLSYTVEYYKDNNIVAEDTEIVSIEVDANAANTLTFDTTLLDNDKYEGFRLNNTIPEQVPNVVETGTTIKRYKVRDDGIPWLLAENHNYPEHMKNLYPSEITIQGIALKVIKDIK